MKKSESLANVYTRKKGSKIGVEPSSTAARNEDMAAQEARDQAEADVRLDEASNKDMAAQVAGDQPEPIVALDEEGEKSAEEHDPSREGRKRMKNDPRHRGKSKLEETHVIATRKRKRNVASNREKPPSDCEATSQSRKQSQYRSNLVNMISFVEGLKFKECHFESLRKTAFNEFLIPFMKKEITIDEVKKSDVQVKKVISSYNKARKCFLIGGEELQITPQECQLIFGINSGKLGLSIASGSRAGKPDKGFAERRCEKFTKLTMGHLKKDVLLDSLMESEKATDIDDVVRILILNAMVNFFFSTIGDFVPWFYLQYIENLEDTNLYNWGREIVNHFIKSVQEAAYAEKVQGCSLLLIYWLCERSPLFQPASRNKIPRFRNWNLKTVNEDLARIPEMKNLKAHQVHCRPLEPTNEERARIRLLNLTSDDEETDHANEDVVPEENAVGIAAEADQSIPRNTEECLGDADPLIESLSVLEAENAGLKIVEQDLRTKLANEEERTKILEAQISRYQDIQLADRRNETNIENEDLRKQNFELQSENEKLKTKIYELGAEIEVLKANKETYNPAADSFLGLTEQKENEHTEVDGEDGISEEQPITLNDESVASERDQEIKRKEEEKKRKEEKKEERKRKEEERKEEERKRNEEKDNMEEEEEENAEKGQEREEEEQVEEKEEEEEEREKGLDEEEGQSSTLAERVRRRTDRKETENCPDCVKPVKFKELVCRGRGRRRGCIRARGPQDVTEVVDVSSTKKNEKDDSSEKENEHAEVDGEGDETTPNRTEHYEPPQNENPAQNKKKPILKKVEKDPSKSKKKRKQCHSQKSEDTEKEEKVPSKRQKKENSKIVNIVNVEEQPPAKNKKKPKLPRFKSKRLYKELTASDKQKIIQHIPEYMAPSGSVWKCPGHYGLTGTIHIQEILLLVTEKSINGSIIDAYSLILMRRQQMGSFKSDIVSPMDDDSFMFPGCVQSKLVETQKFVDDCIKGEHMGQYKYLLFPLNSRSHWTLLAWDSRHNTWKFYNSCEYTQDPYLDDAKDMITALEVYDRDNEKLFIRQCAPLESVANSPQQHKDREDCGIFVLMIAEQIFAHQPIDKENIEARALTFRKELIELFLNDMYTTQIKS